MAENSRTFTSIFDLVDRFTAPYDAIQKKMNAITGKVHQVDIEFNESKAGQALDNIQKKVNDTTSTTNSWNNALGRAAGVADKTASSTQKIGNEAQKTTGFLGSMQSKLENVGGVADKLRDKFGAITGLLAGGSIGGMSWLNAMASEKADKSLDRRLARMHIDTKPIDDFIAKAEGTGYTTTSTRQDIAESLLVRTKLRGSKMESTTKAIEDLYFQNSYYLNRPEIGINSAQDLTSLLTKKKLGPGDKQTLIDLGITGTSATSRLRSAEKQAKGIDETTLAKEDPYQTFLNRLSETSKKVGKTMIEPMNMVLGKVNDLLDLINNIPGAPGLIALVAVLMAAAGGASLLLTVLGPLIPLMTALKVAMFGQAVATAAASTSTSVMAVAGFGGAAANTALAASSTAASGGFWAMAAGIWAAVAPLLLIVVPLIALSAALYMVEQKTHIFSKAFKQLGKTEMAHDLLDFFKDVGYWLKEAIKWVDSLYKMLKTTGLSKVVLGAAFGPIGLGLGAASMLSGKDPGELLGWIVDQDKNIVRWIVTTFPFFARIHEILKKVLSVFEWLYSLFQSFWSWIQRAMPGAEKETARQKLEKDISGANNATKGERTLWYDYNDKSFWTKRTDIPNGPTQKLSQGELADLYGEGRAKKFVEKAETYESKPGFAEGIAEAVKKGISSIGDTIAEKIKAAFPDLAGLISSLTDLVNLLKGEGDIEKIATETTPKIVTDAASLTLPGPMGAVVRSLEHPVLKPVANWGFGAGQWVGNQFVGGEGHAAGATFTRSGLFAGKVHSPEEIIPQAIASKGAGPISRALSVLDSVMSGQPSSVAGASSVGDIHIHNSNDFSGMKVSGNVDIQKLMAQIDKRIDSRSVEAVKKAIGQRRT